MTREQLAHVLRTVARISGEHDILVIGSQSILGSYPEGALPARATGSMEVDTAFFTDPDGAKADVVDVNLGEFSEFHNEFAIPRASASAPVSSQLAGAIASSSSKHREPALAAACA